MTTYSHICSCGNPYQDTDPDGYFCPSCVEQRKAIAKEIDAKLAGKVSKRAAVTPLQEYDAAHKIRGFIKVKL